MNFTEMLALCEMLNEAGISYQVRPLNGGMQILGYHWDAICNKYSYGHDLGLIEVMGLPRCHGDVIGHLTAKEAMVLIKEHPYI